MKKFKASTFSRLLSYLGAYRSAFLLSLVFVVLSTLGTLFAPLVIGRTIDRMAGRGSVDYSAVTRSLILLCVIYLVSSVCLWLVTYLLNNISYRTVNRLRRALFDKLNTLALVFFDRHPHGDTVSRFVNDVDTISDGMLQGLSALLSGIVTILGAIVFMLFISPPMALLIIASAPAAYLVARAITKNSQRLFREQAKQVGILSGLAEEMIEGQRTVKAFRHEAAAESAFREINAKLYEVGVKSQFISSIANPSTRIVNNLTFALIGIVGGIAAIHGQLTVGDLSSLLIYAIIFAKPFSDITNVLTQLQAAGAGAQRVFEILDLAPDTPDRKDAAVLSDCGGSVRFENVSFAYQKENPLIESFNLTVAPGSRVAIVGHTGAGKTTLVNLLMRFYDVDGGSIRIDGTDIRDFTRDSLRACFGMVLQDTWLFEGSIRDNIAYAKPDAAESEIVRAARAAGADPFIRKLANGYDTVISGDGENLSQGQKQLLTIARVMLLNPPIIILDEATSSIDTYTEQLVQRAFEKMTENRTSFVIAHRLSTVRNADLILVMDKGHVVESGGHEALLAQNGVYAELYNSQFAGKAT